MLNPNDLFAQIGFVVENSPQKSSRMSKNKTLEQENYQQNQIDIIYKSLKHQRTPSYVTSLEIELTQDQNHILQIKSYDDPFQLANNFCQQHNLNILAVEVVQKKIIEAKRREELRLRSIQENQIDILDSNLIHSQLPHSKLSNSKQILPHNNCNQDFMRRNSIKKKISDQSRSITPSKSIKKSSVSKINKYQKNQDQKNKKKLDNKESQAILSRACQSLYQRGLQKNKALQQKRMKRQQQLQQKQAQEFTFKPKINEVSEKIIEFRKQTGTVPPKNLNKIKNDRADQFYRQLQECTFTPEINPISKMIVHNRESYLTENYHFNELFNCTETQSRDVSRGKKKPLSEISNNQSFYNKKSKEYLLKQKEFQEKELFKPKLNPKSIEQVKQPFFTRLQKAIEVKQKIKQGEYKNNQFTFQPQVGRSPFYQPLRGQNSTNNKQNIPVWQQLYRESQFRAKEKYKQFQQNKSRNQLTNTTSHPDFQSLNYNQSKNQLNIITTKTSTNLHYENLIQKRINTVFQLLDSDEDGLISPNRIGIQNLSKNTLIFLKPVFQQMDQLDAQLNYNEFRKAVINLLNDSDIYKKGLFLSDNKRNQNQFTFTPKINPKSKELAQGRNISQIHIGLYEQGVKNLKRKEMLIERQKAKKQEMELQECSFKPCLHLGRKDYHPSILDRKLSDIQFSVNQSSNSHLLESSITKENYHENESY